MKSKENHNEDRDRRNLRNEIAMLMGIFCDELVCRKIKKYKERFQKRNAIFPVEFEKKMQF